MLGLSWRNLLIILWMSYFLYPQLAHLPEARENRFSTEERAKFQQGNLKIYTQRRRPAPGPQSGWLA